MDGDSRQPAVGQRGPFRRNGTRPATTPVAPLKIIRLEEDWSLQGRQAPN
jgi:hypothetical protein